MSDDMSHNDAMTVIKVICALTDFPLEDALGYYKVARDMEESRRNIVYDLLITAIARDERIIEDILNERE